MDCGFLNFGGLVIFAYTALICLRYFWSFHKIKPKLCNFEQRHFTSHLAMVIGLFTISAIFVPLQIDWLFYLQDYCKDIGTYERVWAVFQMFSAFIVMMIVKTLLRELESEPEYKHDLCRKMK